MAVTAVMFFAVNANAADNSQGKFALHYAGAHDSKLHDCTFTATVCGDIVVDGGPAGRYDVYILAVDVEAVAGVRYGLTVGGAAMFFYGWTKCSDFEIPSPGWPGDAEDNAQTWTAEQVTNFLTIGVLDVYAYGGTTSLSTTIDSRVSKAEMCDGSQPSPICVDFTDPGSFGTVGFNSTSGVNPCTGIPVEPTSWGKLKAMYH